MKLSSFLQWKINIFLYQILGWRIAFSYITILGALYFFFKGEERSKINEAVESVFAGRTEKSELKLIKRNVFKGIRSHYYEKLFNAFSSAETLRAFLRSHFESEGMSAIEEGLSKGKGVLLITGHIGGIEFIPGYLAANNYPVSIIVRFSSNHLRRVSIQKADKFDTRLIEPHNTPNMIKVILDNLRENRVVITQCDEIDEWRPSDQAKIDFLGKQINLDKTINVFLKRRYCAIVFGIMHRSNQHRYKFILTSWKEMARQCLCSGDMSIGATVLKFLEQYIYKNPEEWYQWPKYADIKVPPSIEISLENPAPLSLLKPSPTRLSW